MRLDGALSNPANGMSTDIRWVHQNRHVSIVANGTMTEVLLGLEGGLFRDYMDVGQSCLPMGLPLNGADLVALTIGERADDAWAYVCSSLADRHKRKAADGSNHRPSGGLNPSQQATNAAATVILCTCCRTLPPKRVCELLSGKPQRATTSAEPYASISTSWYSLAPRSALLRITGRCVESLASVKSRYYRVLNHVSYRSQVSARLG